MGRDKDLYQGIYFVGYTERETSKIVKFLRYCMVMKIQTLPNLIFKIKSGQRNKGHDLTLLKDRL